MVPYIAIKKLLKLFHLMYLLYTCIVYITILFLVISMYPLYIVYQSLYYYIIYIHSGPAELLTSIYHSFEAGIANAISSFK